MTRRLVVLSEIIAPYRIPVFNALAQQADIDLHVIFLAETDPQLRQWRIYKEEIRFSYEVLRSWRTRLGDNSVLLNWGLTRALRRSNPDVILCGGYNYPSSWRAAWWARRNRIPLMLWIESTAQDRRSHQAVVESLKRRFLRGCDAFVVAGKSSGEYLRTYGVSEDTIFPAPNAVDSEFFRCEAERVRARSEFHRQRLGLPSRFFLFVGRLVAEKGVFDLLSAYGALVPSVRAKMGLVFAGDGSARGELSRKAALIHPGQVQFAGFVQRETLAAYYALAGALVFPTRSDPWGLVVNEAMSCGLPVISSAAAGCAADLVEHGWNGTLVSPGDVARLADAMDQLARSESLITQMGERSRLRINRHSPETCAAGIVRATVSLPGGCVA